MVLTLESTAEHILGAAFEVSNTLGAGFLERVYQSALLQELKIRGLRAASEVTFPVVYKGHRVGEYYADLVVEELVVVELKCAKALCNEHVAQCLNYLTASNLKVRLLLNFEKPKLEWRRILRGIQLAD